MKILDVLSKKTYVVEHNPNCAKPFLVRLVGNGRSGIDKKPYATGETRDILGFGMTFEEAAGKALDQKAIAPLAL